MMADVWVINVLILIVMAVGGASIDVKDVIKSFFPNIFGLNWYITCYILFCLIHDKLNLIIESCTKKELLTMNIIALLLYYGSCYIKGGLFFASELITFIVIYFFMAYIKRYLPELCNNKKLNLILCGGGYRRIVNCCDSYKFSRSSHFTVS